MIRPDGCDEVRLRQDGRERVVVVVRVIAKRAASGPLSTGRMLEAVAVTRRIAVANGHVTEAG
jgi:hypothetical protein